jgi:hypothetical protein
MYSNLIQAGFVAQDHTSTYFLFAGSKIMEQIRLKLANNRVPVLESSDLKRHSLHFFWGGIHACGIWREILNFHTCEIPRRTNSGIPFNSRRRTLTQTAGASRELRNI